MYGQSSINFFDINNKKRNQGTQGMFSGSSTSGITNNTPSYTNKYTKEMEQLDKELKDEGLIIERLSDQQKRDYVNSLSESDYQRLNQYRDAGYSFGSAKALLELERQRNGTTNVGGYRGQGFQITEPLGGAESRWNRANVPGYLFEKIDDRVQGTLVPMLTVNQREKRTQELLKKYNSMTEKDWNELYKKFLNDPEAKTYADDSLDYTLKNYWEKNNKTFWDKLRGADINFKEDENGKVTEAYDNSAPGGVQTLANAPVSTLANATAVMRGVTNPLDNAWMLFKLLGTQEGRDILAYRYLDQEGRTESAEQDPVGRVLDLFDFGALGLNASAKTTKLGSYGSRLVGAKGTADRLNNVSKKLGKASDTLENIADMGLSRAENKILDKALNRLSAGGKVSNLVGDYLSLSQRPLRTIRSGANPKDKNGRQIVPNGSWTIGGVERGVDKVLESIKEKIQTQATGLTPEVRERIRQNPYIGEYRARVEEMLNQEGAPTDNQRIMEGPIEEVGKELLRRLEEYEARLEENGSEYQALRSTTKTYDFSDFMLGVYEVFANNGITINADGELDFRTTANPADMNPVNTARYVIKNMEPNLRNMTIAEFLDFRKQIRSLINYESDSRSTRYSKKIIRQIVDGQLNKLAHKMIPSLAKVDEIYHKQIDELKEFKDGLIYQQGEKRGQIKDNFYSIISTINTQNRQKMKSRIEKIFPDLGARVEAIRMLPILAKTYQNSPKLVNNMLKTLTALTGIKYTQNAVQLAVSRILRIIADELISKPLGEKRRKQEINELLKDMSPEAQQKLAEIKSKVDAGVDLSEQEKQDLKTAMQEIAMAEYEYLDEQHRREFDKILESANNQQPKLPAPGMDVINPDGTITLGMGNPLNSPDKPITREQRVQQVQDEYQMEGPEAEEMTNSIEDFLDEIGGDINGEVNPREVDYNKFSTKNLNELMNDDTIPYSEKEKINKILVSREGNEANTESWENLDKEFAYRINQLQGEEQRVGKVGKNKVNRTEAKKQQAELEAKREKLKIEMRERYAGQGEPLDQDRVEEKYSELEGKSADYINSYKRSTKFRTDSAEKKVLQELKDKWSKEPKFTLELDDNMSKKRQDIVSKPLKNGYEWETTNYNDRIVNKQTGDKGIIKYKPDGTIEVTLSQNGYDNSGIMDIVPADADIRFINDRGEIEPETIKAGVLRGDEYQTVGRANPNEKDITAEEGLATRSFKGDKTIDQLADDYGLEKQIVDKIFTDAGEEALGRARGNLVELAKWIKEGTAPHEVFHPIFNMVNKKRRQEIIDLVRKNKGMTEKEAKEWLADSFSEYFRTGKFDTKPIPKGFVNKVKRFFNKVKEFVNGMYRDRKKIQKLFDDIMEGKIERESIKDEGYEYQLKNDEIYERSEKEKERKLERLLTNKSYSAVALEDAMVHTYDPDFDTWLNKINTYLEKNRNASIRSMLNRRELVDAYSIMQEYGSEGVMDFYKTAERVNSEDGNKRMSDTYELLKKMKKNPLKIPDDIKYEPRTYELRQTLYDIETPLNYLVESYDPDPLEWINEIRKTGHILSREVPKYGELVKIQNLLDKFIESGGKKIEGTFNDKMINKLVEKRINKNSRLGSTFDEKAIIKIGGDIEETLQNRTSDFINYRYRTNGRGTNMPDEVVGDFVYALGNTYDPNIDIWKENMEKELKKMFPNYNPDEKPLIWEHQYQTLKSRIEQLGKYDNTDYQMLREDDISGVFLDGVNNKKTQQIADKSEKATQDLVAVSGLSIDNFKKQIKGLEGKSPMPSIGITDPNVPHENRGELTLVFGKDTVDPKANPENVIYGSDAYTPMFPSTKTTGGLDLDDMHRIANQINDKYLGSDVGVRELIVDRIKDLKDLDIEDNESWESEYIRFHARFEQQVNSILEERMDEGIEPIELEDEELHDIWDMMVNPILENQPRTVIRGSNFEDGQKEFDEGTVRWYVQKLNTKGLIPEDTIQNLGGEDAIVSDIVKTGTEDGVDGILNVFENYNIDPGDSQSREIAQAIYNTAKPQDRPYTAENALEAMKSQRGTNRSTRPGSFRDMIGAEGTKIWLEDVRDKNFGKMVHDEYLGNTKYLEDRYDQIVSIIGDEYMGGYPDDGLFHQGEHDEEVREMIKDAYDTDIQKFKDNLRDISKPDGTVEKLKLPDEMLQRIVDLVEQGKKVPVRFSESKPQRVVDLYEEVKYVLVPDKDVERVSKMVEGTPLEGKIEGYKPDDYSAPRSKKIKELQKKYGNIFFSFGGAIMPIAMLLYMMQGDDEGEGQQA